MPAPKAPHRLHKGRLCSLPQAAQCPRRTQLHRALQVAKVSSRTLQACKHARPELTGTPFLPFRFCRYATIGKLTVSDEAGPSTSAAAAAPVQQVSQSSRDFDAAPAQQAEKSNVVYTSSGEVFRPSRKVRQLPGGGSAQVTALFGSEEAEDQPAPTLARRAAPAAPARVDDGFEPLGAAPARRVASGNVSAPKESHFYDDVSGEKAGVYEGVRNDAVMNNGFRPTRRVRVPGGTGGLSSISFE